jgi:hypothetical protein
MNLRSYRSYEMHSVPSAFRSRHEGALVLTNPPNMAPYDTNVGGGEWFFDERSFGREGSQRAVCHPVFYPNIATTPRDSYMHLHVKLFNDPGPAPDLSNPCLGPGTWQSF